MSSRLAVPILALVAVPVIAAAALLAAFAHGFVSEDVAPSPGRAIEGSVWIVTGLIAWWRVPGNRIGPLATAFGFVDVASLLYWDAALPFSLAPIVGAFIFAIGSTCSWRSRPAACRRLPTARSSPSPTSRR
jgi:hypothetical protein